MRITNIVNVGGSRKFRRPQTRLSDEQVRKIYNYRVTHSPAATAIYFGLRIGRIYNLTPRFNALGLDVSKFKKADSNKPIIDQIKDLQPKSNEALITQLIDKLRARVAELHQEADELDRIVTRLPQLAEL